MGKNLLSRRQFMNMCKAVFDFDEYGIKPYLRDVCNFCGRRYLKYYFEDQDENEYSVLFSFNGYFEFYVHVYKLVGFNKYQEISTDHFNLNCSYGRMIFVYRSGFSILKKALNLGNIIRISDGRVIGSLQ